MSDIYRNKFELKGEKEEVQEVLKFIQNKQKADVVQQGENTIVFDISNYDTKETIEKMSEANPKVFIAYQWSSEELGRDTGMVEYYEGEQMSIDEPIPYSKEAYEMSAEIFNIDLNDEYVFNEKTYTYDKIEEDQELKM